MEGGREEKQVPLEGKAIGGGKEEEGREAGVCVYVCVCVCPAGADAAQNSSLTVEAEML